MAQRQQKAARPPERVAKLSDEFLSCRDFGHSWRPLNAELLAQQRAYRREQQCSRCATRRWQMLSMRGQVLSGGYLYPDGYLFKGFDGSVAELHDSLRLEHVIRLIEGGHDGS